MVRYLENSGLVFGKVAEQRVSAVEVMWLIFSFFGGVGPFVGSGQQRLVQNGVVPHLPPVLGLVPLLLDVDLVVVDVVIILVAVVGCNRKGNLRET